MNTAVMLDTRAYIKKLRDVDVDERQVEVQAETLLSFVEEHLATRKDLLERETNLKRDNKALELRMVIQMGAVIMAGIGLVVTANRIWPIPVQSVSPSVTHETQIIRPPVATPSPITQSAGKSP